MPRACARCCPATSAAAPAIFPLSRRCSTREPHTSRRTAQETLQETRNENGQLPDRQSDRAPGGFALSARTRTPTLSCACFCECNSQQPRTKMGKRCTAASFRSRHTARRGYAGQEQFPLLLQFFDPTRPQTCRLVRTATQLAVCRREKLLFGCVEDFIGQSWVIHGPGEHQGTHQFR